MTTDAPAVAMPSPVGAAFKDAFICALIALGLALPMMGLITTQAAGGMFLQVDTGIAWLWRALGFSLSDDYVRTSTLPRVALAVGLVFVGRLILNLTIWRPGRVKKKLINQKTELKLMALGKYLAPAAILIAIALPFIPGVDRYQVDLGILVLTYVMLGWGLNIVVGLAGLLDLGYVAFYAVGAYSYALLAHHFGLSFWICLPLAGILASFWGVILGFPVLRLRGDYLAIVTLAFGEIIRIVLLNWYWVTGGPNGITGIPKPSFFGIADFVSGPNGFAAMFGLKFSSIHRIIFLYYLILALALITNFFVIRLRRLPIGRAWEALREDEIACRSLGVNTVNTKLTAFALGAMFAGFAGSFFATRQGFISPESFVFMESALILAIVVLGGMGSQFGVAIAALVMIGGFELFREFKDYRMIVFGLVMVLIMVWRPRGLVSSRTPSVFLKQKKAIAGNLVQEGHG